MLLIAFSVVITLLTILLLLAYYLGAFIKITTKFK